MFLFVGLLPYLKVVDKQWDHLLPHILDYNYTLSEEEKPLVAKKIRDVYLGKDKLNQDTFLKFSEVRMIYI